MAEPDMETTGEGEGLQCLIIQGRNRICRGQALGGIWASGMPTIYLYWYVTNYYGHTAVFMLRSLPEMVPGLKN
jgi:hypothetical protein